MKSITILLIKICLLGLLIHESSFFVNTASSKLKLKLKSQSQMKTQDGEMIKLMESLFTENRCPPKEKKDGEQMDDDIPSNEAVSIGNGNGSGYGWTIPKSKHNKYEKRLYGWGPSAYLFDYLDPVLQEDILSAFEKLWNEVKSQNVFPSETDKIDPYTLQKIFNMPDQPDDLLLARFQSLKPSFSQKVWKESITVPQLRQVARDWNYNPTSPDFAREIVDTYDYNGDGRLSPREFIIAYLNINRAIIGSKDCKKDKDGKIIEKGCIHQVVVEKLHPIFLRIDCSDYDDKVGAEEIWTAFSHLKRFEIDPTTKQPKLNAPENKFNIFECKIFGEHYHTTAVNDFVLKSQKTIDGYLNKLEFVRGILLGYWARKVDDDGIRNRSDFKDKRWTEGVAMDNKCKLMTNDNSK